MKINSKNLMIVVVITVALLFGAFLFVFRINHMPTRASLIANFDAHRGDYNELRDMLLADDDVLRVADWGVETNNSGFVHPPQGNFSVSRYDEYLRLLRLTGARWAFRDRGHQPDAVGIGVWASGFGGDTRHIEICWFPGSPTSQTSGSAQRQSHYEQIDGNWYLRRDF